MIDKDETLSKPYEFLGGLLFHELDLLFGRFNFFLTSTAFIITAFALVATSMGDGSIDTNFSILGHAIIAVGLYVAYAYAVTSYLHIRVLRALQKEIVEMSKALPFSRYQQILNKEWRLDLPWNRSGWLSKLNNHKLRKYHPLELSKRQPSIFIVTVPILFVLFWLIIWFVIFSESQWVPWIFGVGVISFTLIVLSLYDSKEDSKDDETRRTLD